MFVLNTSRPLFKNNPSSGRRSTSPSTAGGSPAREGGRMGTATDQYLLPVTPGFRDERIYPLKGPDVKKARELAKGHTAARQGGALHGCAPDPASPRHRSSRTT